MDPNKFINDESPKDSKQKTGKKNHSEIYVPSIPVPWLEKIYMLPGAALKMALVIWRAYRMQDSQKTFKLTKKYLEPFGVTRYQRYRGLSSLEKAGLIEMDHKSGRAPVITLLDIKQ